MRQNTRIFHKIVFLVHHIIIIELSVKLIITEKIEIKLCLHKNIYNIQYSIFNTHYSVFKMGNFCSELSAKSTKLSVKTTSLPVTSLPAKSLPATSLPATSLPKFTLKSHYPYKSVEEHFNNICEDFWILNTDRSDPSTYENICELFDILDIFITNHKIEEVIEIKYVYSLDRLFYIAPILLECKRIRLFYEFLEWTKPSKFLLAYSNNSERTPGVIHEIMKYDCNLHYRYYAYKCVKLIWEHVDSSKRSTWSERHHRSHFIERVERFLEPLDD